MINCTLLISLSVYQNKHLHDYKRVDDGEKSNMNKSFLIYR